MHLAKVGAGSLGDPRPRVSPSQAVRLAFLAVRVYLHVKAQGELGGCYQELTDWVLELETDIVSLGKQHRIM